MSYQCHLCHQPLHCSQLQWRCHSNYQFDCAKEGYVNLLPVHHKRSKLPGDSVEMMQARRAFLDAGYLPAITATGYGTSGTVAESRCNGIAGWEGYYTAELAARLEQRHNVAVYGLDIAKVAIRYAAKRYPAVSFCVASNHRLPFAERSMDAVLRIYAPCKAGELARVVKPGGILMTVSPGPRHLYQLKAQVYQQVQLHDGQEKRLEGFGCESREALAYTMALSGGQAANLLQMTPFAWRAPRQRYSSSSLPARVLWL
ncbi:23S rRNA (guanine(745)-N(1))-methyltransferase [Serratia symbiotica]|uniref:23S rRNA (guanine(745)-N(1))-methyltransferase n=1 Tax=Serratia symbiotica TaxID=138074 RepID=UPI0020911BE4|nr:23S rRNA (guanine(745)-N(1))-methyltransferase [Serratia symbiotica]USS96405.1 23S rRNA (guanine(745)-N(1))-methyltransferase [Serratia symbiotica]